LLSFLFSGHAKDADTIEVMNDNMAKVRASITQISSLRDAAAKSAKSLKDHIKGKAKSAKSDANRTKAAEVKAALDSEREKAKDGMKKVAEQQEKTSPIFDLNLTENPELIPAVDVQTKDLVGKSPDVPCLYKESVAIAAFLRVPKAAVLTGNFGSTYKRAESVKKTGKHQELVMVGH
jgi:hypothetical protein